MSQCHYCSREIVRTDKMRAHYCSKHCAKAHRVQKYKRNNPYPQEWYKGLSTGTVGACHELLVCADLIRRGWSVYRALSPAASCDMLALFEDRIFRVEVTTGVRGDRGELKMPAKDAARFDLLAVVERSGNISYFPELSDNKLIPPKYDLSKDQI